MFRHILVDHSTTSFSIISCSIRPLDCNVNGDDHAIPAVTLQAFFVHFSILLHLDVSILADILLLHLDISIFSCHLCALTHLHPF